MNILVCFWFLFHCPSTLVSQIVSFYYTPVIHADGYIVFAFPFVRSSVCMFVCLFVRLLVRFFVRKFRNVRRIYVKVLVKVSLVVYIS